MEPDALKKMIDVTLCELLLLKKEFKERLEIRTYRNLPTLSLFGSDYQLLAGWYWQDKLAFTGPILKVIGSENDLYYKIVGNFDLIWQKSDEALLEVSRQKVDGGKILTSIGITADNLKIINNFLISKNRQPKYFP